MRYFEELSLEDRLLIMNKSKHRNSKGFRVFETSNGIIVTIKRQL